MDDIKPNSQLLIYHTPSGDTKLDVRLESDIDTLKKQLPDRKTEK